MADLSGAKQSAAKFIANGGGAITFRLLSTVLGMMMLALGTWGLNTIVSRFDRVDTALANIGQQLADTKSNVNGHTIRLDHLESTDTSLWLAVHSNANRLDDHEHRLSRIEGELERR